MAVRKCPQCLTTLPAGYSVAYTDGMDCPGCNERLEVSGASRMMATLGGLLAGALVWRLAAPAQGDFGWVLPMVYSIFTWAAVTPLMLMSFADLRVCEREPEPEPAHSSGHGAGRGGHH